LGNKSFETRANTRKQCEWRLSLIRNHEVLGSIPSSSTSTVALFRVVD